MEDEQVIVEVLGVGSKSNGELVLVATDGEKTYATNPRYRNRISDWNFDINDEEAKRRGIRALTDEERVIVRKRFGPHLGCSFAYDLGKHLRGRGNRRKHMPGYYCYTHRAASKRFDAPDKIAKKAYNFIRSTA